MTSAMAFDSGTSSFSLNTGAGTLSMQRLDAEGLRSLAAADWDALSAAALVENPFYDRRHLLAGLDTMDQGKPVGAYSYRTSVGQLVGLFPVQPGSSVPAPFPVANSLANIYQFNGTPLVHRDHAETVVRAWAQGVASGKEPGLWAFADFDTGSVLSQLMAEAATAVGLSWRIVTPYERAHLTRQAGSFEAHLSQVLSKNRLQDVRRTMRRLGEVGRIELEQAQEPTAFTQRLDDFFKLEHSGWKGTQGTSFLSRAKDTAFARAAYVPGFAALDSLLLDGKPIAMKLVIRTGRTAFTPKIAYDETYKKLGPGMALEYLLVQAFYADNMLDGIDSASTAEGHSALNFFDTRKAMGTVLVGRHGWQVGLLARLHEGRKALKAQVKAMLAYWKARGNEPQTAPK